MPETLQLADGRAALRFERRLDHPPEKVWRAITEPQHLSQWYPFPVTGLDLAVGGTVEFDDEGTTLSGEVVQLDPPRVFAFTEEDDQLHFELRPDGAGCLLVFTHTFTGEAAPGTAEGWRRCLDTLATLIAASPLHDQLGSVETADGRTALRFERQLGHPPAKVWRAITEAAQLTHWFAAIVDRDLTAGARVHFTMTAESQERMGVPAGQESLGEGEVTVADPPQLLEYTWGDEVLRWELTDDGAGGCRLVFTNTLDGTYASGDAGVAWHAALEMLQARLDGRPVTWSVWDRVDPLTAFYRSAVDATPTETSEAVHG